MSKQISIIGGHGQIARQLSRDLVARGHQVRGLVRSSDQFDDVRDDGSEPVLCDLESSSDEEMDQALDGANVVVFAAGSGPGSGPERKRTLDRDGAVKSVESAVRIGSDRFVIISSMGAEDPPEDDETFSVYLRAKHDADTAVRAACDRSGLVYTIVRPGKLTDEDPAGTVTLAAHTDRGEIPRADVAAVLAALIDAGGGANSTLELISGETAIPDAVDAIDQ